MRVRVNPNYWAHNKRKEEEEEEGADAEGKTSSHRQLARQIMGPRQLSTSSKESTLHSFAEVQKQEHVPEEQEQECVSMSNVRGKNLFEIRFY